MAESQSEVWLLAACILAIYTASIFIVAASGRSVEDLVGVFSIQKTIKLGSSSECFAGSQSSANSLSSQDKGLADNQPPGLAGLSIEPKAINASSSHSINLTAHITDDQSGLAESLAGRFEIIAVPHWSFTEMREAFGWTVEQYIFYGAYPGAAAPDSYRDQCWQESRRGAGAGR